MNLRTRFNYDSDVVSFQTGLVCDPGSSRTQQHMRDECDINFMLEKFGIENLAKPPINPGGQVIFDQAFDFQESMNQVVAARNAFLDLPAKVRARFSNDPGEFLDFFNDPDNAPEARRLGLLATPVSPDPDKPPVGAVKPLAGDPEPAPSPAPAGSS